MLRTCNGLPFGHACSPGSPSPFPAGKRLIERLVSFVHVSYLYISFHRSRHKKSGKEAENNGEIGKIARELFSFLRDTTFLFGQLAVNWPGNLSRQT